MATVESGCSPSRPAFRPTATPTAREHDRALALLMTTDVFADGHVGIDGAPSEQAMAFYVVLHSPRAAASFTALVENGSLPGKLYGLSGLYLTDRRAFKRSAEPFRASTDTVPTYSGCIGGWGSVASLVSSRYAMRIHEPVDLPTVWQQMTGTCDIAGGCYPYSFASIFAR